MEHTPIYLNQIYKILLKFFGHQQWWPAQTPFEVIVGAILTQNTNWRNVERAITNLKDENLLTPLALKNIKLEKLAACIKPVGYFNVKARRLKSFVAFLFLEYEGDLKLMAQEPLETLRSKLLNVHGIGPETADCILLYALNKPIFVVDMYTKRLLARHGLIEEKAGYDEVQKKFMAELKPDAAVFNEYHALIVQIGKKFCRTQAACGLCPLNKFPLKILNNK